MPIIVFLISFLIYGCQSDPDENRGVMDSWGLKAPRLVSLATGTTISFRELELRRQDFLYTSDLIHFEGIDENIELEIKSFCGNGDQQSQHEIQLPLPEQISIGEILPSRAQLKGAWTCNIEFLAIHPAGHSHSFELNSYPIKNDRPTEITIGYGINDGSSLNRVYGDQAFRTQVQGHKGQSLKLECNTRQLYTQSPRPVSSFLEFKGSTKDPENTKLEHSLECRIFDQDQYGRHLAVSDRFWLTPKMPQLSLEEFNEDRRFYEYMESNEPKLVYEYVLKNTGSNDEYFYLKKHQSISGLLMTADTRQQIYTERHGFTMQAHLNLKPLSQKENSYLYKLPAHGQVKIRLQLVSYKHCGLHDVGIYIEALESDELPIISITDPKLGLTDLNVRNYIPLGTTKTQWIGRKVPKAGNGMVIWKHDKFGALPPPIGNYKNQFCR